MSIKNEIKNLQMVYQQRYAKYTKAYDKNNNDMDSHGHAMECSYVLINVFFLTDKEVMQLEKNDYEWLLDSDFED